MFWDYVLVPSSKDQDVQDILTQNISNIPTYAAQQPRWTKILTSTVFCCADDYFCGHKWPKSKKKGLRPIGISDTDESNNTDIYLFYLVDG